MAVMQIDAAHGVMAMVLLGSGRFAPPQPLTDHRFDLAWVMGAAHPWWILSRYYTPIWTG